MVGSGGGGALMMMPLGAMCNHSCKPNCQVSIDPGTYALTATVKIS